MKTTNQTQEQNTFKSVSGKSIFLVVIFSILFITTSFGNYAEKEQQNYANENSTNDLDSENSFTSVVLAKPTMVAESENELSETILEIISNYEKPFVEIIKENESIIESKEEFDFTAIFGTSIDEIILENEMIIESNLGNEEFPLDLELINNYSSLNREAFLIKTKNSYKS